MNFLCSRLVGVLAVIGGLAACASVEPNAKPLNAVELYGRVSGVAASPYHGLSGAQLGAATMAGGVAGVALAGVLDAQSGNRGVSSVGVAVSPTLLLTVPVNRSFQDGDCVKLYIDPMYRELLARKDVPNMSLPVGSTWIEKTACPVSP